jgi:hypothetical protein
VAVVEEQRVAVQNQLPAGEVAGGLVRSAPHVSPSKQMTYLTFTMPGGFQVPSPGGRIEGASVFGQ